jgi:hypothetical protein
MKWFRAGSSGLPAALRLDFQHPAGGWYGSSRRGLILLALALTLLGWQSWRYLDLHGQVAAAEDRLAELRKKPTLSSAGPDAARNESLSGLRQPWGRLLSELASAGRPGLALLSLEAEGARGSLRLTGEADSLEAVLSYVEGLAKAGFLTRPELVSHETRQVEGRPVVAFVVHAGWGKP